MRKRKANKHKRHNQPRINLRYDPSRTNALRAKITAELNRKFTRIYRAITDMIVQQDVFGLIPIEPVYNAEEENCGIGEGGFQPGNTCASGGKGFIASIREEIAAIGFDESEAESDGEIKEKTWTKMGPDMALVFDTAAGSYTMFAAKDESGYLLRMAGVNYEKVYDIAFEDSGGSFGITGKAGAVQARDVFRTITSGVIAFAEHKKPFAMTFSAAEPSRQKLYDRLAKTLSVYLPGYSVLSYQSKKEEWEDHPTKYYVTVKSKYRDLLKKRIQATIKEGKVDIVANELNPLWFDPMVVNWLDDDDKLTTNYNPDQPRDESGRWGDGVSSSSNTKEERGFIARVRSSLKDKYKKLVNRYGERGAQAVAAGIIALMPLPIPGTTLIPLGIAEAVRGIRQMERRMFATNEWVEELTENSTLMNLINEARSFMDEQCKELGVEFPYARIESMKAAIRDALNWEDVTDNMFCATGEGGGIDPTCGKDSDNGFDLSANVGDNCGIGPNGFEPGNTCAKGRGNNLKELDDKEIGNRFKQLSISILGGLPAQEEYTAYTRKEVRVVDGDRALSVDRYGDVIDIRFSIMGQPFLYQADSLQKGSIDFASKLKTLALAYAKAGFSLKNSGTGDRRQKLYEKVFKKAGLVKVGEDKWGLVPKPTTNAAEWKFNSKPEQVEAFKKWLKTQIDIQFQKSEDELWIRYIQEGLKKGAQRTFNDYYKGTRFAKGQGAFYQGSKEQFMQSAFAQPVAVDKVKLMAGRSFNELQGITDEMSMKITRTLTDGLVQGKNPMDIAKDLSNQVNLSKKRAAVMARTEIVRANAEGQILAIRALGIEQVGVAVEWKVNAPGVDEKDGGPCKLCAPLEGAMFSLAEAEGLIPRHPNCRCAFIPVVGQRINYRKTRKKVDISVTRQHKNDPWVGAELDFVDTGEGGGTKKDKRQIIELDLNQAAWSALDRFSECCNH